MEPEAQMASIAWVDFELGLVLGERESTLGDADAPPPAKEPVAQVDEL